MKLPIPRPHGDVSVERAIALRRSIREYGDRAMPLDYLSQLLWAAQGATSRDGLRAAPSAGATYPLETCAAAGNITGLAPGVYNYASLSHELVLVRESDVRNELAAACLEQMWMRQAPVLLVFSAIYSRIVGRYSDRGIRYAHMEAGHAAQNVALQAIALGMGTVMVGAFDDERVKAILGLPADQSPLYIIPVGYPA